MSSCAPPCGDVPKRVRRWNRIAHEGWGKVGYIPFSITHNTLSAIAIAQLQAMWITAS